MPLIYYIPAAKTASDPLIAEHQLPIGKSYNHRETHAGPQGPGILVADAGVPVSDIRNEADWSPRYGYTSSVGTIGTAPAPEQLARPKQLSGSYVELLDGRPWRIPLLRQWHSLDDRIIPTIADSLPRTLRQSPETGEFQLAAVIPQYRDLWEHSLRIADMILDQLRGDDRHDAEGLSDLSIDAFACRLLGVNYYVDASVVSHLGLLTPDHSLQIVRAALDLERLRDLLKKSAHSVAGNTSVGVPPQTEDASTSTPIDPPSPSS